jgi:hypothetical protein
MKKLVPILCSVVVLASIGGAFAIAEASTGTSHRFTGTFSVTRKVTSLVWQHADPGTLSVGDRFEFTSNLVSQGDVIGHQGAVCTILHVRGDADAYECVGTYLLPGGTITAQAYRPANHPISHVAITGGTGIYQDARGQIEFDGDTFTFEVS